MVLPMSFLSGCLKEILLLSFLFRLPENNRILSFSFRQPGLIQFMRIILAPMQGYADDVMRALLSRVGGFDETVGEFVRITSTVHSRKIWLKYLPELAHGAKTAAGTPCTVQLLGSDAHLMAENALAAVECGARKIDLNFGCPAATVNKHQGGAILLDNPALIEKIVRQVRFRLPEEIPLSAKMRLGYADTANAVNCARAIENGGAAELTVHARTKIQQYDPPAHWHYFALIQNAVKIPVIANGDIFSREDVCAIQKIYSPQGIMLGRGALMQPDLALQIKDKEKKPMDWGEICILLNAFLTLCQNKKTGNYPVVRCKQWLRLLQQKYPEAGGLFARIRPMQYTGEIQTLLQQEIAQNGV